MSEGFCEAIDKCSSVLKLDFSSSEVSRIAEEQKYSMESVAAVNDVFAYICAKKEQATIQMLMKTSRLPLKTRRHSETSISACCGARSSIG